MGRLFWKFLFSYWAALLVVVLGVATTAWLYRLAEDRLDLTLETGPRASFVIDSAAATASNGGLPALLGLLTDWSRHSDVWLFAVDDSGRDILGRDVSREALARARTLANGGRDSHAARRVELPQGGSITLFVPFSKKLWLPAILFPGGPPPPWIPLAVGSLVSLAFGALLAWYIARPIRHLREAFDLVADGHLETRVARLMGGRRDEVADLGRRFDSMTERLQSLMSARQSLLHEVSHELRSPLARLQAATGLARQNPRKLQSSLERIEQEAERLDELVGQLLTLSRLEAGIRDASQERLESTDLIDLVASIAEDARYEAELTGRSVVFSGEGEVVASVRAQLIHRAVENVVRNAVRFTRPGTTVNVFASFEESERIFAVKVTDHGPGVAPSELEAIFEPFFRSASGSEGPGFGLGLAITRRAVEAHGGTVRAANCEGSGLEIEIRIPVMPG